MAECVVRLASAAALCLCLRLRPTAGGTLATAEPPAISEYVLLIDWPSISVYSPLDRGASAQLLFDTEAVPNYASCAYFNHSVYCVGGGSAHTWRFSHVDGSPLPPGPELNRHVEWPGNGHAANINDEWLVTCGDFRTLQPNTCQVLHVNASHWVDIESQACGRRSALAQHNGSAFIAGGQCNNMSLNASAEVWSLSPAVGQTAAGDDPFQWRRHPDMNTPRDELATASHDGYLYACGGWMSSRQRAVADCERWREGMHSWQGIALLPQPRERLHMLSVDGRLIAMGGYDSSGEYKLDVFDYVEPAAAYASYVLVRLGSRARTVTWT